MPSQKNFKAGQLWYSTYATVKHVYIVEITSMSFVIRYLYHPSYEEEVAFKRGNQGHPLNMREFPHQLEGLLPTLTPSDLSLAKFELLWTISK